MIKLVRIALAVSVFAFGTVGIAHAGSNLVNNGSFETEELTDWTISGDTSLLGACNVSNYPRY